MKLLSLATTRQRIALVACILLAIALIVLDVLGALGANAQDAPLGQTPLGAVCPPGAAKYETGVGYEYGADHATITVAGSHADWQAITDPATIVQVCIKSSTTLYWPPTGPRSGAFSTPDGKDISHVVVYMETPTSIDITRFTAEAAPPPQPADYRALILGIIAAAALYTVIKLAVDMRNQDR